MKTKSKFLISTIFLIVNSTIFVNNSAEAKVVMTGNIPEVMQYDSGGSNYSGLTLINEYGQIIYDLDKIPAKYQKLVIDAAESWNSALQREVFINYHKIGVQDDIGDVHVDKVDINVVYGEGNSFSGNGYITYGYGDHKGTLTFTKDYLSDKYLKEGTEAYASAVSAIRHELGHALGLGHDYGVVMFTNSNPNSSKAYEACMADLRRGTLPTIPTFNILAIQNILNNLSPIYYNYGYGLIPSKIISSARIEINKNSIISSTFFNKKILFNRDSATPIHAINLEDNTSVDAKTLTEGNTFDSLIQVTTINDRQYYLISNTSKTKYYGIKSTDITTAK